jgi:hypothetical protein
MWQVLTRILLTTQEGYVEVLFRSGRRFLLGDVNQFE